MQNINKSVQIIIHGRVQHVGFRYSTHEQAIKIGINGFVMNKPDGTVYIEAEATQELLDRFLIWCHKGPGWSKVTKVEVIDQPLMHYDGFTIKR